MMIITKLSSPNTLICLGTNWKTTHGRLEWTPRCRPASSSSCACRIRSSDNRARSHLAGDRPACFYYNYIFRTMKYKKSIKFYKIIKRFIDGKQPTCNHSRKIYKQKLDRDCTTNGDRGQWQVSITYQLSTVASDTDLYQLKKTNVPRH